MVSLNMMVSMRMEQRVVRESRRGLRKARTRLLALFALCWAIGASFAFHFWVGEASAAASYVPYTVAPGDTVWSIASRITGGADPRPVMSQIIADNHLNAAGAVHAGEVLELPQKP